MGEIRFVDIPEWFMTEVRGTEAERDMACAEATRLAELIDTLEAENAGLLQMVKEAENNSDAE